MCIAVGDVDCEMYKWINNAVTYVNFLFEIILTCLINRLTKRIQLPSLHQCIIIVLLTSTIFIIIEYLKVIYVLFLLSATMVELHIQLLHNL